MHASLDESLSDSDFTTVLTGSSIGLEASSWITSPGFAVNTTGILYVEVKANGQDGPIVVSPGTTVSVTVSLNPGSYDAQNADWWVVEATPSGTFNYYNLSSVSMVPGLLPTHQGPLFTLGTTQLLSSSDLTVGTHTFYFAVDLDMNGSLDMDSIYYNGVNVTVQQ